MKSLTRHNTGPPYSKACRLCFTNEERAGPEFASHNRKAEMAMDSLEKVRPRSSLHFEGTDRPKLFSKFTHAVAAAPMLEAHRQINRAQDENVGVEAVHGSEMAGENGCPRRAFRLPQPPASTGE